MDKSLEKHSGVLTLLLQEAGFLPGSMCCCLRASDAVSHATGMPKPRCSALCPCLFTKVGEIRQRAHNGTTAWNLGHQMQKGGVVRERKRECEKESKTFLLLAL